MSPPNASTASGQPQRMLIVEAFGGDIQPPKRYRNAFGQLLEHSPYCERDLHGPSELPAHAERGEYEVRVKVNGEVMSYFFDFHPVDVVGWDGYLYPYSVNIGDSEPITGRVDHAPPAHPPFAGRTFGRCSFCPRQ